MAKELTTARTVAAEICSKFSETPSLTLAKKLFTEYPEVYKNIEHARSLIRTIRGKNGDEKRKKTEDKKLFEEKPRPLNPFALPKSYAKKRRHVEVSGTKFLILCDLHFPYQDNEAIECAINEGIKQGCDSIILNGDALDCHMISDFVKDPRKRKFKDELYSIRQFLVIPDETYRLGAFGETANDGITLSIDSKLEVLRNIAARPYPVILYGFDELLANANPFSMSSGAGVQFAITDFSITSMMRTPNGGINRAQCDITLQEVPIEYINIISLPKLVPGQTIKPTTPGEEPVYGERLLITDQANQIVEVKGYESK